MKFQKEYTLREITLIEKALREYAEKENAPESFSGVKTEEDAISAAKALQIERLLAKIQEEKGRTQAYPGEETLRITLVPDADPYGQDPITESFILPKGTSVNEAIVAMMKKGHDPELYLELEEQFKLARVKTFTENVVDLLTKGKDPRMAKAAKIMKKILDKKDNG